MSNYELKLREDKIHYEWELKLEELKGISVDDQWKIYKDWRKNLLKTMRERKKKNKIKEIEGE